MAPKYFDVMEYKVLSTYVREYPGATILNQEENLYLPVKQYAVRRTQNSKLPPVTIIAASAIGTPKEAYEPIWESIYEQSATLGFEISGIWMADPVNQSQGELLNGGKLGDDSSWMDHSRDLFQMINQFRDQMPRPLIGIGHSGGAPQIANLSFMHPRLLTSVIFLDPAILKTPPTAFREHPVFHKFILNRPESWPSRSKAESSISKWPNYSSWDKRCLQRFFEHSIVPVSDTGPENAGIEGPVQLSTSVAQEIHYMGRRSLTRRNADGTMSVDYDQTPDLDPIDGARNDPLYRYEMRATWNMLPELRPSAKFILGGRSYLPQNEVKEGAQQCGTGRSGSGGTSKGRVREVMLKKGSHFFPLEMVDQTAEECAIWILSELERFAKEEKIFKEGIEQRLQNGERIGQDLSPWMKELMSGFAAKAAKSKM